MLPLTVSKPIACSAKYHKASQSKRTSKTNENATHYGGTTAGPMKIVSLSTRCKSLRKIGRFRHRKLMSRGADSLAHQSWQCHVVCDLSPSSTLSSQNIRQECKAPQIRRARAWILPGWFSLYRNQSPCNLGSQEINTSPAPGSCVPTQRTVVGGYCCRNVLVGCA